MGIKVKIIGKTEKEDKDVYISYLSLLKCHVIAVLSMIGAGYLIGIIFGFLSFLYP